MLRRPVKIISILLCLLLVFQQTGVAQVAGELDISGHLLSLRNALTQDRFRPLHLRFLAYDNLNNNFKLLLDRGDFDKDDGAPFAGRIPEAKTKKATRTLLNYFFAGLTLPNDSFWVNLRPDSPENIIDPFLEQTDLGRVLLEADLQLKKDTAGATSPATPEGKEYWDRLYQKAGELFGSENITIPTLTRPWIVPGEIIIRETQDNAYIYKATLKVMLEEDYLKSPRSTVHGQQNYEFNDPRLKELNSYSTQLIKELIIPKLTKEVNTSKRYAPLRQVYYSLILASWFKQRFSGKEGLYPALIDKKDLNGLTSKEPWSKTTYFREYQKSFQQGEYNIKDPAYTPYGRTIRSYMSGGINIGADAIASAIGPGGIIAGSPLRRIERINPQGVLGEFRSNSRQPYSGEIDVGPISTPQEEQSSNVVSSQGFASSPLDRHNISSVYANREPSLGPVEATFAIAPADLQRLQDLKTSYGEFMRSVQYSAAINDSSKIVFPDSGIEDAFDRFLWRSTVMHVFGEIMKNAFDAVISYLDPEREFSNLKSDYVGEINVSVRIVSGEEGETLFMEVIDNGLGNRAAKTAHKRKQKTGGNKLYYGGEGKGEGEIKDAAEILLGTYGHNRESDKTITTLTLPLTRVADKPASSPVDNQSVVRDELKRVKKILVAAKQYRQELQRFRAVVGRMKLAEKSDRKVERAAYLRAEEALRRVRNRYIKAGGNERRSIEVTIAATQKRIKILQKLMSDLQSQERRRRNLLEKLRLKIGFPFGGIRMLLPLQTPTTLSKEEGKGDIYGGKAPSQESLPEQESAPDLRDKLWDWIFIAVASLGAVFTFAVLSLYLYARYAIPDYSHQQQSTVVSNAPPSNMYYSPPKEESPYRRFEHIINYRPMYSGLHPDSYVPYSGMAGYGGTVITNGKALFNLSGYQTPEMFITGFYNAVGSDGRFFQEGPVQMLPSGERTKEFTEVSFVNAPMRKGAKIRVGVIINGEVQPATFAGGTLSLDNQGWLTAHQDTGPVSITYTISKRTSNNRIQILQPYTEWMQKEFEDIPASIKAELDRAKSSSVRSRLNAVSRILKQYFAYSKIQDVHLMQGTWCKFLDDVLKRHRRFVSDCDVLSMFAFIFSRYLGIEAAVTVGFSNYAGDSTMKAYQAHAMLLVRDGKQWVPFEASAGGIRAGVIVLDSSSNDLLPTEYKAAEFGQPKPIALELVSWHMPMSLYRIPKGATFDTIRRLLVENSRNLHTFAANQGLYKLIADNINSLPDADIDRLPAGTVLIVRTGSPEDLDQWSEEALLDQYGRRWYIRRLEGLRKAVEREMQSPSAYGNEVQARLEQELERRKSDKAYASEDESTLRRKALADVGRAMGIKQFRRDELIEAFTKIIKLGNYVFNSPARQYVPDTPDSASSPVDRHVTSSMSKDRGMLQDPTGINFHISITAADVENLHKYADFIRLVQSDSIIDAYSQKLFIGEKYAIDRRELWCSAVRYMIREIMENAYDAIISYFDPALKLKRPQGFMGAIKVAISIKEGGALVVEVANEDSGVKTAKSAYKDWQKNIGDTLYFGGWGLGEEVVTTRVKRLGGNYERRKDGGWTITTITLPLVRAAGTATSSPAAMSPDIKMTIEGGDLNTASSAVDNRKADKGGIDFSVLPVMTQPVNAPAVNLNMAPAGRTVIINSDREWLEIENMLNAGIVPSTGRIKDYLIVCCTSSAINQEIDKVLSCLAGIMRMEEERVENTDPALKEILTLLESDKPADQMQAALAKISVSAAGPKVLEP